MMQRDFSHQKMSIIEDFQTGVDKHKKGRDDEAIQVFERVIAFDPGFIIAYCMLSAIYVSQGHFKKGIDVALKGLASAPDNEYIHYALAAAYEKSGRVRSSICHYEFYLKRHPEDAEGFFRLASSYFYLGEKILAEGAFKQSVAADAQFYKSWLKIGTIALERSSYKEAIEAYSKAIYIKNDLSEAYFNLGLSYFKDRQFNFAIQNLEIFNRKNPAHALTLALLGECYLRVNNSEKAIVSYRSLIMQDMNNAEAHCGLGLAYLSKGDFDKASKEADFLASIHSSLSIEILKSAII